MDQPDIRCSHILQKHTKSRNPIDRYRNKQVTRSKEEAIRNIESIMEELKAGGDFAVLAEKYSECGSAKDGGDLGMFHKGQMQKPFEDAAFALAVGELTLDPVDTDSGIHIILRLA